MRIVYLHGFASSPQSSKARFFSQRFAACGIPVQIPELDQGDFTGLTIGGQLEVIERTVAGAPAILMGSSLGGYLAALFASRHRTIEKLILMAPALRFPSRLSERYSSAELDRWRRDRVWPVHHYGANRVLPLGYGFYEDSQRYEDEPEFSQPALIFHGTGDEVVPADISRNYAARRPNVELRLFDSGHELTDAVEEMWTGVCSFLGIAQSRPIAQE